MAIVMMTSAAVDPAKLATGEQFWITSQDEKLLMAKTYEGCVLSTYERNGYHDSDFFAHVWDEEKQAVITIEYATTRGWTYPNNAVVDATPEVKAKVAAYEAEKRAKQAAAKAAADAKKPAVGKLVKVVAGRKVAPGKVGRVFWMGVDKFARKSRYTDYSLLNAFGIDTNEYRLGVDFSGDRQFIPAKYVEVVIEEN